MPSNLLYPVTLRMLFILAFFTSPSLGTYPWSPVSPGTLCDSTPNPSYCKSLLPNNQPVANVYDYGRFCVQKSLSQSIQFSNLVDEYVANYDSTLSTSALRALQDCQLLASLNKEFLLSSFQTVNKTSQTLPASQAEDIHTLLSAILTNQQTCQDGLQATSFSWSVNNYLPSRLSEDARLQSVSLALFTRGWVPYNIKRAGIPWHPMKKLPGFWHGRPVNYRRPHQTGDGQVLVSDMVTVSQDGTGNFTTINDAIAAAPNNTDGTDGYYMIYIAAGVYQEYISIPNNKPNLLLVGDGINQTIITGNHSVVDGWTTFNSATFAVIAPNFTATGITFRNTAGAIKQQAVAVRNGADMSVFYSCSFEGYQDTLYAHSMRQFYRECDIYGTVDYLFGNAAVVFQDCNLYPRLPINGQFNTITAQGRIDPNQNTGISIQNCTITPAQDLVSANYTVQTYLGRPWKNYSRTVVMQSYMDSFIDPAGWHVWSGEFALGTLYYAEYNNAGPGSNTTNRVTWPGYHVINSTDAANFTVANFLQGDSWLPNTGVPYTDGLM